MAPKKDLGGMKFLIAAAAVSGTVGGWIALAGSAGGTQSAVAQDPALENLLNQPMPTLQESTQSAADAPQGRGSVRGKRSRGSGRYQVFQKVNSNGDQNVRSNGKPDRGCDG
jgi:hypothetical protein